MKNLLKQLSCFLLGISSRSDRVVFGVVGGVFTATESAAAAVIHSLDRQRIYLQRSWTERCLRVLGECVDTFLIVLILIATSSIFGYCLG